MKAPFIRTAIILVAAAGLGYYVWQVEMKRDPDAEKKKDKIVSLDKSQAKQIEIVPLEGETLHLEKGTDGWSVVAADRSFPADGGEVDSLLRELETLEIADVVAEPPAALADFGLEPPARTVTVTVEGGSQVAVAFGARTPTGNEVYATLPSQGRVLTVGAHVQRTFDKAPFDLRDRDLLHVKRDAIQELQVAGASGGWTISRDDGGEWAITQPVHGRAGRWSVDSLLGLVEGLRMESVAAEEATASQLSEWGFDKPAWTVRLSLGDAGERRLAIGAEAGEGRYHARVGDATQVVVIPKALVDDLAKGFDGLRAKRLLDVAVYDVMGFDIVAEGTTRTWSRTDVPDAEGVDVPKWKRVSPEAKDYEARVVQDALFLVGGVDVKTFIDSPAELSSYGLDQPAVRLTLRSKAPRPEQWCELGTKDGAWFARRPGESGVLELDPVKAGELVEALKKL